MLCSVQCGPAGCSQEGLASISDKHSLVWLQACNRQIVVTNLMPGNQTQHEDMPLDVPYGSAISRESPAHAQSACKDTAKIAMATQVAMTKKGQSWTRVKGQEAGEGEMKGSCTFL